jgi:SAM-dependent methyltransferase
MATTANQRDQEAVSPLDGVPPFKLFGGVSQDAWRWVNLEGRERCGFLARYLPELPGDPDFQAHFTGRTGTETLAMGHEVYELFKALYEKHGKPLVPSSRVLEFGCGWGRVIRFFLKDVAPENLIGIDSYEPALAAAAETNRWCRFSPCEVLPPSDFKDGSFDLVYAFVVFCHLSEEAHERWLEEFARLLKTGGVLILTTYDRVFLENCADTRPDVAERLTPLDEHLSAYDRGEFCYSPMVESHPHFGDAFIPEEYVRRHWTKHFVVREFFAAPGWVQNIIVCTKQ